MVEALVARGVAIPAPASVEIGDDVDPERIAPGVVIHTGCRIAGANTSIGPGCELGAEGPATVEDCQLGRNVALRGGYFSGADVPRRREHGPQRPRSTGDAAGGGGLRGTFGRSQADALPAVRHRRAA